MSYDASQDMNQVYTFAPGEGQRPLSLYQDQAAEYLSFPTIFCGKERLSDEQREVRVSYADIAKWELRSFDRRAAQSVPNLFFKLKKIQMKQVTDKCNLALRKSKTKGKIFTANDCKILNMSIILLDTMRVTLSSDSYEIHQHIWKHEKKMYLP